MHSALKLYKVQFMNTNIYNAPYLHYLIEAIMTNALLDSHQLPALMLNISKPAPSPAALFS